MTTFFFFMLLFTSTLMSTLMLCFSFVPLISGDMMDGLCSSFSLCGWFPLSDGWKDDDNDDDNDDRLMELGTGETVLCCG